jgi:hypothetical protein
LTSYLVFLPTRVEPAHPRRHVPRQNPNPKKICEICAICG